MSIPPPTKPVPRSPSRQVAVALAILAAALASLFLWYSSQTVERTAIGELPAAERRELYDRTLRTLATSCAPETQPEGFERFCREQADFIVQFPECDETCRKLAKSHETKPTK